MQRETYGYRAYGLQIRSELELPELEAGPAENPDITIRLRAIPPRGNLAVDGTGFEFGLTEQYLAWLPVGAFLIHGDHTIDIDPAPEADEHLLHLPLLGPVLGMLLYLRGFLLLHASAIEINGATAVFLGDKGAGKSTTAAAIIRAGHRLLTDDVLAVDYSDPKGLRIAPGFPQIKLNHDAADAVVFENSVTMPEPTPDFVKRLQKLTEGFSGEYADAPKKIFVLRRGEKAAINPLPPGEALRALMRFSYVTRFQTRTWSKEEISTHMKQCAQLASVSQVCELETPDSLDRLTEVVELLERDLASN